MPDPLGRHGRRLSEVLAAAEVAGDTPAGWWEPAVVESVTPGAGYGGSTLVVVAWRGDSFPLPYLDSYSPTVGHNVILAVQPPQAFILGRAVGRPPTT